MWTKCILILLIKRPHFIFSLFIILFCEDSLKGLERVATVSSRNNSNFSKSTYSSRLHTRLRKTDGTLTNINDRRCKVFIKPRHTHTYIRNMPTIIRLFAYKILTAAAAITNGNLCLHCLCTNDDNCRDYGNFGSAADFFR